MRVGKEEHEGEPSQKDGDEPHGLPYEVQGPGCYPHTEYPHRVGCDCGEFSMQARILLPRIVPYRDHGENGQNQPQEAPDWFGTGVFRSESRPLRSV